MADLKVTGLDFDQIKANLKQYMRSQERFKDYDFDGAGLSVLLDILAYNTHYNGIYANFAATESHLTTARMRDSVVSRAKELGYTPRSVRAARAVVDISAVTSLNTSNAQETSPGSGIYQDVSKHGLASKIVIEPGKKFTTTIDGKSFEFVNLDNIVFTKTSTQTVAGIPPKYSHTFTANDVVLTQGTLLTYSWIVDFSNPDQRFVIPNANIDTSTLTVTVYRSQTDRSKTIYYPASSFSKLDSSNRAYWLWEVESGKYEIEFGDNVLGKALDNGNQIFISYVVTDGQDANYCKKFTSASSVDGITNVTVTTDTPAYGGKSAETLEEIKFSAIRSYAAQNRAVTAIDYETIIKNNFSAAESVAVWGGETNDPPEYGKVYISIKPVAGITLTETVKEQITEDILAYYVVVSVIPVIIQPDYIQLVVNSTVRYNARSTIKSRSEIATISTNAIVEYVSENVSKFNTPFRFSDFLTYLQDADTAITSCLATYDLKKRFAPNVNGTGVYTIDFVNEIVPGTIKAGGFTTNDSVSINPNLLTYELKDDGAGFIDIYRIYQGAYTKILSNAGTVDYTKGRIILTAFDPVSVTDTYGYVYITCTPKSPDIVVDRNNIIVVDPIDVTVNAEPEY